MFHYEFEGQSCETPEERGLVKVKMFNYSVEYSNYDDFIDVDIEIVAVDYPYGKGKYENSIGINEFRKFHNAMEGKEFSRYFYVNPKHFTNWTYYSRAEGGFW